MKADLCLGCHTYFQQGETVPLESMFIQFKNYFLPIKDSRPKWILLKTLVGFLNSKGGTIYIGIQDNQGKVIGQQIKRKQQDEFQLFIKSLADKITPAVDFINKEEIKIVYVPVVNNKVFKGKFIIKIIVKQGDPSKTYHFNQIIELQFKGKIQKYDIPHAFYRHNMGGIVEIKGQSLLQQIARKAATPNQVANTFHKFCNPQPLRLGGPLTKIGFSGVRKEQLRKKLQQAFHDNLRSFDIEYQLTYDIQNQVLLIQLENEEQFKRINKYLQQNVAVLNQGGLFNFIDKGEYLDFYLYKSITGKREIQPSDHKNAQKSSEPIAYNQKSTPIFYKEQILKKEKHSEKEKQGAQKIKIEGQKKLESPSKPALQQEKYLTQNKSASSDHLVWQYGINENAEKSPEGRVLGKQKQMCEKYLQKQFVLTITHINPQKNIELQNQLKSLIDNKYTVTFETYKHTIQLKFVNRQNVVKVHQIFVKNNQKLSKYGQNNNLVIGINMKSIRISNYNWKKRKQLNQYIHNKLKKDCEQVEFKKWNNKFFLQCKFKTNLNACECLDDLLDDTNLDQFNIPETEASKPGKIRVYIYCICN